MPDRGRTRRRAAIVLCAAFVVLLAGCADSRAVSASLQSPPRPAAPASGGELPGELPDELPGLDDLELPDALGDETSFQECLDLTEAYTQVVVLVYTGDPDGTATELFGQLREQAPPDVVDDLDVLEELVRSAGDGGLLDAAGVVLDEDFEAANSAVVEWITGVCAGSGG